MDGSVRVVPLCVCQLCDVLFSLAAHACDVAKAVADKTGYKWTPPALQGERPRGPSQRQLDITSYSLWCNYMRTLLKVRHPGHQGPSKEELSELWAELPADEKAPWEKQARDAAAGLHPLHPSSPLAPIGTTLTQLQSRLRA